MWAEGAGLDPVEAWKASSTQNIQGTFRTWGHAEHLHLFELQGLRAFRRLKVVATPRAHGSLGALVAFRALA